MTTSAEANSQAVELLDEASHILFKFKGESMDV
jgi:hypothetical protein